LNRNTYTTKTFLQEIPDLTNIFVGGITFEDGTIDKELASSDFNEIGEAKVRYIRPATSETSICHTIKGYQGTAFLGTR